DDADVLDRIEPCAMLLRQSGYQLRDVRDRHRRDHMVGFEARVRRLRGDDPAIANVDELYRLTAQDLAAVRLDAADERIDQHFGSAVDVAELLLEYRTARRGEALDPHAEPRRGNRVGQLVELELETALPQQVPDLAAGLAQDPFAHVRMLELGP